MRFAMVTTYTTPANTRGPLLAAIAQRGHAVTVVSPEPAHVMRGPLAELGADYAEWSVKRTGVDPLEDLAAAWQLYRILRASRFDVVLTYQVKAVLLAPTMARLARVRRVVALVNGLGTVFD